MAEKGVPTSDEELLREELERLIQEQNAQDRGVAYRPPRIVATINKDRIWFKVAGADDPLLKLESVQAHILAAAMPRALYTSREDKAPTCSSGDSLTGRLNPELMQRVSIPDGQNCASCPYNEWGTATNPDGTAGRGKACSEGRALLMRIGELNEPVIFRLSPTSIKAWDNYASGLAMQRPPTSYIVGLTEIGVKSVREGNNEYGVATFKLAQALPMECVLEAFQERKALLPMLGVAGLLASGNLVDEETVDKPLDDEQPAQPF